MKGIREFNTSGFINRQIAGVTITRELGRGSMGVVFVGTQTSLKREVAVKVLPKSLNPNERSCRLFRDEAETVAVLAHPNIIPVYTMGEESDCFYQVMQLVEGSDLRTILKMALTHPDPAQRLLPVSEALRFTMQILDGLGAAHAEEVVHQDIKPANILVESRSGRPLIADFGIARVAAVEYEHDGFIVGTPLYLSPEQAASHETDGRADIYSVGVMLFEMLAGTLPLRSESMETFLARKIKEPETLYLKQPTACSARISPALEAVILRALAPRADDRFADCRSFIKALAMASTS